MTAVLLEKIQAEPILYKDEPVVTLSMVDRLHQRPGGTAGRNFRANKSRFVEGVHFWEIGTDDEIRRQLKASGLLGSRTSMAVLLSEKGYLKLVKSFQDDLSWEIQDKLIDCYFRVKEQAPKDPSKLSPARAFLQMAQNMVEVEEEQQRQALALKKVEDEQDQLADTVTVNQQAIASLHRRVENNLIKPGEITAHAVADRLGLLSGSGQPHYRGVIAVAKHIKFIDRKLARWADSPRGDGEIDKVFVFTLEGYDVFKAEFAELSHGKGEEFKIFASGRNNNFIRRAKPGKN